MSKDQTMRTAPTIEIKDTLEKWKKNGPYLFFVHFQKQAYTIYPSGHHNQWSCAVLPCPVASLELHPHNQISVARRDGAMPLNIIHCPALLLWVKVTQSHLAAGG